MKRTLFVTLLIALLLPCVALCEETLNTPMDQAFSYTTKTTIEPLPIEFTVETVPTDPQYQMQLLGVMLVDLYAYETSADGMSDDDSLAARIYRNLQKNPGIVCLTAVNQDAVLINGLYAVNNGGGSDYATMCWIEYNTEENTMRFLEKTIEKCADAEDFLSEYVFSSSVVNSVGANIFFSTSLPDDSVVVYWDGTVMKSFFDGIYEDLYHSAPNL